MKWQQCRHSGKRSDLGRLGVHAASSMTTIAVAVSPA
jgi:hypothetical protein